MIRKINRKTILIIALLIIMFFNLIPTSKAVNLSGEINIYTVGFNDNLLLYKNDYFLTIFNVYENERKEYPAYNALFPTYIYNNPYDEQLIDSDSFLWQVVVNGYPYKTIEELGCFTYDEAYTATQVAIYCAHCGHTESDYSYFEGNEASLRTYNAFHKILENARKNQVKANKNNIIKIIDEQYEWKQDKERPEYVYRTYHIVTNNEINTYSVEVSNFEKASITDESNIVKTVFNKDESFKILLPIEKLNKSDEIEIKITTEAETLPIYLGKSPYNVYVMTAPRYEEIIKKYQQTYQENLTSINIEIKELDTKIGIENSIVKLLDCNKQLIATLTSDEQGKIFVEHLLPGIYYIEQSATEEGYNIYTKQIQLNMDYNKVLNLTINNAPINIENITNKEENIIITEEIIEKNICNEKIDININNKTEIINENNKNDKYTENNQTMQNNIKNENTYTTVNNIVNIANENNKNIQDNVNNENTNSLNNKNTQSILTNTSNNLIDTPLFKTLPKTGM